MCDIRLKPRGRWFPDTPSSEQISVRRHMAANHRLLCELTIHDGIVVYDLNGSLATVGIGLVISNLGETGREMEPEARAERRVELSEKPPQRSLALCASKEKRDDREFESTRVLENDGNTRRGPEYAGGARAGLA